MNAAGWWTVGILGWVAFITGVGIFIGKVIRNRDGRHDDLVAAIGAPPTGGPDDPTEQWCYYSGSSPDDAVWRFIESGEAGQGLTLLRARSAADHSAKIARRGVVYGQWEDVPINDGAADGAA